MPRSTTKHERRLLKRDLFGAVTLETAGDDVRIVRDAGAGAVWLRWLARWLLRREVRVLERLAALAADGAAPAVLSRSGNRLARDYIPGQPLYVAKPRDPAYFRDAARLLRRLHRADVAHNDLAKEPNILVTDTGRAAFIDFQLAVHAPRRGRLFRLMAREDIRHLLKHKRTYCPERLTHRERRILATPSGPSRLWMRTAKPVYEFVTRRLFGWADREGAADRGARD